MDRIDVSVVRTPPAKFSVFVDENSTCMGESKRYLLGEFNSYQEAAVACRKIIDEFLLTSCAATTGGDELYAAYLAFGEAPCILPDNGVERFSARAYARAQCGKVEMNRRQGFTIVEMLMVIGVISVLVGILLSVIGWSRQAAARVTCMSNMHQLTLCVTRYAAENEGQLPYCNWASSVDASDVYGRGWLFSLPQFRTSGNWLPLPHPPQDGAKTGVLWQYNQSLPIYHCPIDSPELWVGTQWMSSYLMNGAQCGYGRVGNGDNAPGVRQARIVAPCNSVMFWEALEQKFEGQQFTGAVWNDGSSYPNEEVMADRHAKGANIACFDGHVEWWAQSTWTYWVNYPQFGRLWCDPLTPDGR